MDSRARNFRLGIAWILFALSVGLHVTDEALTHFLSVYNPTVVAMRQKLGWWPMPEFDFQTWLGGLIAFVILLRLLSPFMFRGDRWIRPIAYFLIVIMIANALSHIFFSILGRTTESVRFARPAPGFYSSPFLLASAIYLLVQLRQNVTRANLLSTPAKGNSAP